MRTPKISIIVPVYNVEKYLPKCIESILTQTFADFELLLIDDGTPDCSGYICDEYAMKDHRIRVFHKENGGVSSARNLGLREAKGEWVVFVDSDDWVSENYLSSFKVSDQKNPNSITIQGLNIYDETKKNSYISNVFENITCSGSSIGLIYESYRLDRFGAPYCKLYNNSLLKTEKIQFPEEINYGEDTLFFEVYMKYIDTVNLLGVNEYFYRKSSNETLSMKDHDAKMLISYNKKHALNIMQLSDKYNFTKSFLHVKVVECLLSGFYRACINQHRMGVCKKERFQNIRNIKSVLALYCNWICILNIRIFIRLCFFTLFPASVIDKIIHIVKK